MIDLSKLLSSENEYPITFNYDKYVNISYMGDLPVDGTNTLTATVTVDQDATLYYQGSSYDHKPLDIKVYVDDILTHTYNSKAVSNFSISESYGRMFEKISSGTHVIKWELTGNSSWRLCNIAVRATPLITVNLLEPGSLGTEVLYNVNNIRDVRCLKIIGKMNADDFAKLKMMYNLYELDLSEAIITEIPERQFYGRGNTDMGCLHKIVLPEGITKIGKEAFSHSDIEEITIPSTVTEIGESAFEHCQHLKTIAMPDAVTSMGEYVFLYNYELTDVRLSKGLTVIPVATFQGCFNLTNCELHEGITAIGHSAFFFYSEGNNTFTFSKLPSTLKSIGDYAFRCCNGLTDVEIPQNVTSVSDGIFMSCRNLKSVSLPVGIYSLDSRDRLFEGCSKLTDITICSPTVLDFGSSTSGSIVEDNRRANITIHVPDFIVNQYKLNSYWYNYKDIVGFSTAEIQDWTINRPLVLNRDRFEGNPTIRINGASTRLPSLKINGDTPMTINDLYFNGSYANTYYNYPGQILSNCNNITITGDVRSTLWSKAKYWYFYSLPFDIKVSEITHSADNVQKAVRYYDGANRAENGRTGSWKNYEADAIIPAGSGFIMQTNVDTKNYFHAVNNANKQQCVKNVEFIKTLDVNDSQKASNKGWNLVGNPWQCYYNAHMLNFTGPITVWSVGNKTYTAYSITDDDYAISPNEAFFIQCPSAEYNTIGFPTQGRQVNAVIESQNAAKSMKNMAAKRLLVNVKISNGENEDQTRVVLNEKASMEYEVLCDAGKMMSMDESVAQIYTLDVDGTQYAINERPMDTGIVPLGIYAGTEGVYTLSLGRCDAETVVLIDYEAGTEQSLTSDYTFTARAGYDNDRFALRFNTSETTGITTVNSNETLGNAPCYNLSGQRVVRGAKGINIVGGRKVVLK